MYQLRSIQLLLVKDLLDERLGGRLLCLLLLLLRLLLLGMLQNLLLSLLLLNYGLLTLLQL